MNTVSDIKAVILAGGKGTRLRPFTHSLPKPLLPIGEKPIMEILIERLAAAGLREIIVSVGYNEHLIRAYFEDGKRWGVDISYSSEVEPLGTAGPLRLLRNRLDKTFVLVNGDTLTDLDWQAMIAQHLDEENFITVGTTMRSVKIDLGVIKINHYAPWAGIIKWEEKPTHEYLAAMGAYVLERRALDYLPEGKSDLPWLVTTAMAARERVIPYIHRGDWLDIGRPEDYATACERTE